MTRHNALHIALLLIALAVSLGACDKAPNGIIKESDMAPLMADLAIADTYADQHNADFPTDSTRMVLKQSVFLRHGVTQEDYDRALEWYAANMDVYTKVCDNTIKILYDRRRDIDPNAMPAAHQPADATNPTGRRTYPARGDTADIWTQPRTFLLTQGLQRGLIAFDLIPDDQHRTGDKYTLQFRLHNAAARVSVTLAADYGDGATSLVNRYLPEGNWNQIVLQTDTTRALRRIYGSINYNMRTRSVALIDSVALLRTHLDRESYPLFGTQQLVQRIKSDSTPPAPSAIPMPRTFRNENIAPAQSYTPKEGVNKSSHSRHIDQSPNARHMPK